MLYIFFTNLLVSCFIGYYIHDPPKINKSRRDLIIEFVSICFLFPFFEEILFRDYLWRIFSNMENYKIFNSMLFGFCHIANYYSTKNINYTFMQVFITMIMGWYLVSLDSLYQQIFFHCLHNTVVTSLRFYLDYKNKNEEKSKTMMCIYIKPLRKTFSYSDLRVVHYPKIFKEIEIKDKELEKASKLFTNNCMNRMLNKIK